MVLLYKQQGRTSLPFNRQQIQSSVNQTSDLENECPILDVLGDELDRREMPRQNLQPIFSTHLLNLIEQSGRSLIEFDNYYTNQGAQALQATSLVPDNQINSSNQRSQQILSNNGSSQRCPLILVETLAPNWDPF